jgi:LemA protein
MGWLVLSLLWALLLFWAVGAYNRLTRLRAEVLRQWGTVDTVWLKWLMRFQGAVSARQILAWSSEADDLQALQDASDALIEALAEARQQALDDESLGKLQARHEALMQCIDEVALRVPDTVRPHLQSAQVRILQNLPMAMVPYHAAVEQYNAAVAQAPARWLAQRVRLRPAQALRLGGRMEVRA